MLSHLDVNLGNLRTGVCFPRAGNMLVAPLRFDAISQLSVKGQKRKYSIVDVILKNLSSGISHQWIDK